jgi:NhaP-type Na+/H+ or K+/H+ antiporter
MRAQDEIARPLLRLRDVVARGALAGLAAVPLLGALSLCAGDHHDRETFLAVVGGFAASLAGVGILFGLFLWWASQGDIRRCRDWRTVKNQSDAVTVAAPVMLRLGASALVLFPGAVGLYHLVDEAPYGSWLYGG